jgi:hypothetical protein
MGLTQSLRATEFLNATWKLIADFGEETWFLCLSQG